MSVRYLMRQDPEREGLLSDVKRRDEAYAEYEKRTARRIAVAVLTPIESVALAEAALVRRLRFADRSRE